MTGATAWEAAETLAVPGGRTTLSLRQLGAGPPLLLLHGFPQTHLMWRDVAPLLARDFTLLCADLPGYGASTPPDLSPDHAPHSKRAMAAELVAALGHLGHGRFAVAGHDRGGRVAYRMALDHPGRVSHLAVLDVVPTLDAWERADARLALGFWPWSLLAQPAPLPERLLLAAPEAVIDDALSQWGTPPETFAPEIRAAYIAALRDPARVASICEEYRAAATRDREHDAADRAAGRRIACPVLALWSARGGLAKWYEAAGGPLGLWRGWADRVSGQAMKGGHFFPEERPEQTAAALREFCLAR
ncbi:alpha/beta fold hydrolase [Muricoccus radiodurans]|uniref:alpha/beta fold hydrolase n=1 Tax=Muricoccus radiodurans TaxID=2231721 RepID=UPI003CFB0568